MTLVALSFTLRTRQEGPSKMPVQQRGRGHLAFGRGQRGCSECELGEEPAHLLLVDCREEVVTWREALALFLTSLSGLEMTPWSLELNALVMWTCRGQKYRHAGCF